MYWRHQQETLRYVAPECITVRGATLRLGGPSKESDVYSLAMTSFSVCPLSETSYYLIQLSRYDQVLTGVLPYHGTNVKDMLTDIRAGKRPSRPKDLNQRQLLQDPVWDVIATGWHNKPRRRCTLSAMHSTFLSPSQRRQLGRIFPRVASFFQFLQDSEPETQKDVNEMNEVGFSTPPPLPRLIRPAAS